MNATEIQKFVEANWRDPLALQELIGQPLESDLQWDFGIIPTEKAMVETQDGMIVRVQTWSGLNSSARGEYGSPFVVVGTLPKAQSPYPPADRADLTQIKVPRRLAAQLKTIAEQLAWDTTES